MTSTERSLQDTYGYATGCFGCGPANEKGLRIKSFKRGDETVMTFTPQPHHQAFPGILNGGVIGTLLDCHSNWTAAEHLMRAKGLDEPPCTVTADYHVRLKRPTPLDQSVTVRAHVVRSEGNRAVVEATMESGGRVTATFRGTFVAVKPGHPADHRFG